MRTGRKASRSEIFLLSSLGTHRSSLLRRESKQDGGGAGGCCGVRVMNRKVRKEIKTEDILYVT